MSPLAVFLYPLSPQTLFTCFAPHKLIYRLNRTRVSCFSSFLHMSSLNQRSWHGQLHAGTVDECSLASEKPRASQQGEPGFGLSHSLVKLGAFCAFYEKRLQSKTSYCWHRFRMYEVAAVFKQTRL